MSVLQSWDTGYGSEIRNRLGYMLTGFLCVRKRKKEE